MIHELIGNATEVEVLLQTGKEISHFHRLPVLHIAFMSLLGIISHFIGLPVFSIGPFVSHYLNLFQVNYTVSRSSGTKLRVSLNMPGIILQKMTHSFHANYVV